VGPGYKKKSPWVHGSNLILDSKILFGGIVKKIQEVPPMFQKLGYDTR
jgi:hypothetical protein